MADVTVDSASDGKDLEERRANSLEVLNCEMPCRYQKDRGKRVLKNILNRLRLRRCASADISRPDPSYKVAYLGNVVTGWAKGEGCVEKPLATLWRNYTQSSRPDVCMQLLVSGGGLKATTRDHGLTEYWANRITSCAAPSHFPRLFCWVYRHEGRRLRHELRCHAVLCSTAAVARQIETNLKNSVAMALAEFKRDKICRQNARLSLANSVYDNPTMPRRKILLSTGSHTYRPPLERSKSAPKLTSIEENLEEDEESGEGKPKKPVHPTKLFRHCDSSSAILDKRRHLMYKLNEKCCNSVPQPLVPASKNSIICDASNNKVKRDSFRVRFSETFEEVPEELVVDQNSELILNELIQDSLTNGLMESCNENCERIWFRNLPDIGHDSDEGSLSSGCESASTVTSDAEQPTFDTIVETQEEIALLDISKEPRIIMEKKKTELDFKVGGCVVARVRSFDKLSSTDFRKFCGLNSSLNLNNSNTMNNDEVSLIPVGESHSDFSSLKVYKKRSHSDSSSDIYSCETHAKNCKDGRDDEESVDTCSDEGYDEALDSPTTVSNIVLV